MAFIELLRDNPLMFLTFMLYRTPAVLLALTLHEYAHGYVALRCGDPTAQRMGRLSLNPLRHLEPIGVIFMFLFGFGWAKAVPVNPNNFRNGYKDDLKVSLAGVTVNFILYIASFLVMIALSKLMWAPDAFAQLGGMERLVFSADGEYYYTTMDGMRTMRDFLSWGSRGFEVFLMGFVSSDPIHVGLGASLAQYMSVPWLQHVLRFFMQFASINLGLAVFNLFPLPPLDGFHVVNDIALKGRLAMTPMAFNIARLVLLALCFTGALSTVITGVIGFVAHAVESAFAFLM